MISIHFELKHVNFHVYNLHGHADYILTNQRAEIQPTATSCRWSDLTNHKMCLASLTKSQSEHIFRFAGQLAIRITLMSYITQCIAIFNGLE